MMITTWGLSKTPQEYLAEEKADIERERAAEEAAEAAAAERFRGVHGIVTRARGWEAYPEPVRAKKKKKVKKRSCRKVSEEPVYYAGESEESVFFGGLDYLAKVEIALRCRVKPKPSLDQLDGNWGR